jgi:hypothetical protein
MKISKKQLIRVRWMARAGALLVLLLGLPFYFGYGNPLPFANPDNDAFDNLWLTIFPLMFLGLALGWKWERVGGWIVVASIVGGGVATIFLVGEFIPGPMYVPLLLGVLYLISGYRKV